MPDSRTPAPDGWGGRAHDVSRFEPMNGARHSTEYLVLREAVAEEPGFPFWLSFSRTPNRVIRTGVDGPVTLQGDEDASATQTSQTPRV